MKYSALLLCAIITAAFALQQFMPTDDFILVADRVAVQPWTLVTSVFLHGSASHVLGNLSSLALFGLLLESVVGHKRILLVFFATGMVASIASAMLYPAALGASGAIFGVIGALAALRPRMAVPAMGALMPMIAAAALWLLLDIAGVFYPSNVANAAHISGLAAGIAIGMAWRNEYPEERRKPAKVVGDRALDEWEERWMSPE